MKIIEVTSENFEKEVLNSNVPVLVDFYADWCGPCKMLRPILEEIANEKEDRKIKFASLNVDEAEDIAMKYNVSSIPCLVLINTTLHPLSSSNSGSSSCIPQKSPRVISLPLVKPLALQL